MTVSSKGNTRASRSKVPLDVKLAVLAEAGYRCAVPTCGTILALDLHHMDQVSDGGGNTVANLIALCPTCHALHHRKEIPATAIRVWKGVLMAKSSPYDRESFDLLHFLVAMDDVPVVALWGDRDSGVYVTGDGLLRFTRLVAARLVVVQRHQGEAAQHYLVSISERGRRLLDAWSVGNPSLLEEIAREPRTASSEQ